jgi:hypothetical protein
MIRNVIFDYETVLGRFCPKKMTAVGIRGIPFNGDAAKLRKTPDIE